jgi:hypothetical protein
MIKRSWIAMALLFLVLTAAAGTVLRGMMLGIDPGVSYSNLLHAHSHAAILGWAYGGVFLLIVHCFQLQGPVFKRLYSFSQAAVLAMFPAFALQGYAPVSIALSTVHILLSYVFAAAAWKRLKPQGGISVLTVKLAKASLLSLVLSSAGVWCLAAVSATGGKGSTLYNMSLYFFLHFQYNGWLTIGLLAVLLAYLEKKGLYRCRRIMRLGCSLYAGALLPSYLLSVLWVDAGSVWNGIAFASAIAQWMGILIICVELYRAVRRGKGKLPAGAAGFLILAGVSVLAKATMELGLLVPSLWDMIYGSRSVVIGYLHLALLGFVSFLLIALLLAEGVLGGEAPIFRTGSRLFVTGFALNEMALFLQGLSEWSGWLAVPYLNGTLLTAAFLMAAGAVCWFSASLKRTKLEL